MRLALRFVLGLVAWASAPAIAEPAARPGTVADVARLKPYLLLVDAGNDFAVHDGDFTVHDALPEDATPDENVVVENCGGYRFDWRDRIGPEARMKVRALLLKEGTFLRWSERADRPAFKPDHKIGWYGEHRRIDVLLSFASGEALVVVAEDDKMLRYGLSNEAREQWPALIASGKPERQHLQEVMLERLRARSEPVETSLAWRSAISGGAVLAVYEGLPHPGDPAFAREARRGDVRTFSGHSFYTPGVIATRREALAGLLGAATTYHRLSGAKECGGFHPDFAVTWRSDGRMVNLLLCYGCHEAIFTDGKTSLRYDLDHEAGKRLRPLLSADGRKRPPNSLPPGLAPGKN